MGSLSAEYYPPVTGAQPLALPNYVLLGISAVAFLALVLSLFCCFKYSKLYFLSSEFLRAYARWYLLKQKDSEASQNSHFQQHDRSISNLQLPVSPNEPEIPKKRRFKKKEALLFSMRDQIFTCKRNQKQTPHISCTLRLLIFYVSSLIGLGCFLLIYPILEPCARRSSTLNTSTIYPSNSGSSCLDAIQNYTFSLPVFIFAACGAGAICWLFSGLALISLNRAYQKRIRIISTEGEKISQEQHQPQASPERGSVLSNSEHKYKEEEEEDSSSVARDPKEPPPARQSLLQRTPEIKCRVLESSEEWGRQGSAFGGEMLRAQSAGSEALCFCMTVAFLGLASIGVLLGAAYSMTAVYLKFALLAGATGALTNWSVLLPVLGVGLQCCYLLKKEAVFYEPGSLHTANNCLWSVLKQAQRQHNWGAKPMGMKESQCGLLMHQRLSPPEQQIARTSPFHQRRKRVRGLSRSLSSSPFQQVSKRVKGSDFTFNIIPMTPLEQEAQQGTPVMILSQLDSEDEQETPTLQPKCVSRSYIQSGDEEMDMTQETSGVLKFGGTLDETRETADSNKIQTMTMTMEQSIESHATPLPKCSDDKRGLSTIKQEPPTEQRCRSELTTEQKIADSVSPYVPELQLENNDEFLERNLLDQIQHIPTGADALDNESKQNFPTPKPYTHIVRNSLKGGEDEDCFQPEEPQAESIGFDAFEAAFVPSLPLSEDIVPARSPPLRRGSISPPHISASDIPEDGRSTVVSYETHRIFKKRTPIADLHRGGGIGGSVRSVSAQPMGKAPNSSSENMIYSFSNQSSLGQRQKLNSCRSHSETSSFMQSNRRNLRTKRSAGKSESSVFREVGNEIVNHTVRSQDSDSHRQFFSNFIAPVEILKDDFDVSQRSARFARSGERTARVLERIGRSQEKENRHFLDKEAEETHKLLILQDQRRLLRRLMNLAKEQHRVNDQGKISEMLEFLQVAKKPLPASEIKFLQSLEMVNSPYDEQLTRMVKTSRAPLRIEGGSVEKDRGESKRQRELRKRMNEEKISQISGVYGQGMRRVSSNKLSAKKQLILSLSKEKESLTEI